MKLLTAIVTHFIGRRSSMSGASHFASTGSVSLVGFMFSNVLAVDRSVPSSMGSSPVRYRVPRQSRDVHLAVHTYFMKASSSLLPALIGGPVDLSAAFFPPMERYAPPNTVPNVAKASWAEFSQYI